MNKTKPSAMHRLLVDCESKVEMGVEHKVIYGQDGYGYYRATPIIDQCTEQNPSRYYLMYAESRKMERGTVKAFTCLFCLDDCFDFLELDKAVREKIGIDRGRGIHLQCAEKQLGRKLTIKDFPKCRANELVFHAFTMGKRAQRKKDSRNGK